ncbi:hypothetical protein BOX15_Mlig020086g1 [Macrostomum lignano]|uniref:Uncharacterized protein n=1 Tax=Macrostomum lignano TaxID=282301 RepID=A0A267ENB0_9PLAT|nr:hypothetical protein BOX15_Mlig020086g1 [Macrostomum lignano]
MSQHESSYGDDELAEIEQPRLEDSRTSVMQLPPYDLLLMLPNCRALADRTAVLSSTLMQESGPESDWPTASSIGLANSRDSGRLSDKLNNAKLSLGVTGSSSSSLASAAAVVDTPAAVVAATADDASDALIPSISDEQCEGRPDLSRIFRPPPRRGYAFRPARRNCRRRPLPPTWTSLGPARGSSRPTPSSSRGSRPSACSPASSLLSDAGRPVRRRPALRRCPALADAGTALRQALRPAGPAGQAVRPTPSLGHRLVQRLGRLRVVFGVISCRCCRDGGRRGLAE